jgi:hypothetical protein
MTARRPIDSKNIMMLAIDLTKTSSCSPNALLPQAQFYQPAQPTNQHDLGPNSSRLSAEVFSRLMGLASPMF